MLHPVSLVRPVNASSLARSLVGLSICAALSATVMACGSASSNTGSGGSGQGGSQSAAGNTSTGAKSGSGTGGDKGNTGGNGTSDGGTKTGEGGAPSDGGTMTMGNGGMVDFGKYPLADIPDVGTAGVDYVSDLAWKNAVVFADFGAPGSDSPIGKDRSVDLKDPLVINGKAYKKGLGVKTYSQITYALDGKYKKFVSDTGLDFVQDSATMIFEVKVDGKLIYDGGDSTKTKDQMAPVEVDVTGAMEMELYVRDGFDDKADDFGVWGGARLLK